MRNKSLEGKIELLKEFIEEWIGFRDFLREALKDETISAEEEKEFLEIKSLIARKYQGLTRILEKDFVPDERLMDIISHAVSLEGLTETSGMQFRKIENDWHLSYIHLNKLLGNLESEKDRLAGVSGVKVAFSDFARGVRGLCRGVVKAVLILILLVSMGLVGSFFLAGEEKREEGLVNYLVTTVKGLIFRGEESENDYPD